MMVSMNTIWAGMLAHLVSMVITSMSVINIHVSMLMRVVCTGRIYGQHIQNDNGDIYHCGEHVHN